MSRPLNTLIVEDSEDDAVLIVRQLRQAGFDVFGERVETPEAMREALKRKCWDVVISDYAMPHFSGLEALQLAKQSKLDVPFILVSGVAGEEQGVEAMRLGAHDYLTKKNLERLAPAVERELLEAEVRKERRRGEEEIRRLNEELARRVKVQTAQLAAKGRELENFALCMANVLREPLRRLENQLTAVIGQIDTRADGPVHREFADLAHGARQLTNVAEDLLTLFNAGRQELKIQPTGLKALVESILDELQPGLQGREIEWQIGNLPTLQCDPVLMRELLLNLLTNAAKYTRARKPAVIEVGQKTRSGGAAVFVKDNGVGFHMKYADKLFQAFHRLHTGDELDGTGLGLAIVKRIIERHGGSVWAEAAPDQGATFYFNVPASINTERI